MKFEIIKNGGLELIGIVRKIEMKKGAEECPAFWKEFSEQLCLPMMQAGKPLNDKQAAGQITISVNMLCAIAIWLQAHSTISSAEATRAEWCRMEWKCAR